MMVCDIKQMLGHLRLRLKDNWQIASSTATNSDESVTAVTTFTRSTDGSISKIVTVVTQTAGSFKYTQTSVFTRNTDGSIKTITDSYKKEDK